MAHAEMSDGFLRKYVQYLRDYNLFPTIPPSTDQHHLKTQRISTRLFFGLLFVSLTILLLYNSLVTVTKQITVKSPSLDQYAQLYVKDAQTLTCPCKQISISHRKFLNLTYTLHQVCYSQFVTRDWLEYFIATQAHGPVWFDDFRITGVYHFQALIALCELVNTIISDSLRRFYDTQYVSLVVTPQKVLESHVVSLVSEYKSSTTHNFLLSMQIARDIMRGDALLSSIYTNAYLQQSQGMIYVRSWPKSYFNCSCDTSYTCIDQSAIYDGLSSKIIFVVPGIYIGCYVMESLLQSTLECFYNQMCFDTLISMMNITASLNVTVLNISLLSQFSKTAKIKEIVGMLMVEQWNSTIMFADYYNECAPIECTYMETSRYDMLYIITTLIGLVGGLVTGLKLIVPFIVNLVRWKKREATTETGMIVVDCGE